MQNPILNGVNADISSSVTFRGNTLGAGTILDGYPLGLFGTELAVKVGIVGATGGGVGTYVYFHVGNSASLSGGIPITAKRWAVNFIGTGTDNTFGTNTSITGGQGFSDNASPSVAIVIACTGATVADGFYSTT